MLDKLENMLKEFEVSLASLEDQASLLNLKSHYLGKNGVLSEILKSLKDVSADQRQLIGPKANQIKDVITQQITDQIRNLEYAHIHEQLKSESLDVTARKSFFVQGQRKGGLHPVTTIQREIEDIFLSMGFHVLDGPHIEDDYHNFEALNIPKDHPARDMQDTFWFQDAHHLLRTHTSAVQVRGMKKHRPPFRFIAPGKVFRCERTDASHEMCFHQLEGMMVDKDISVGHLIYFMKTLLSEIFKKEVNVRLRPGFFPFVEPGFELDIECLICGGKGCSVCKQSGWVELLPCGMVHPNVLKHGGIDTNLYNGFAFGLGLDRLVMMRYGIDDIRHLHSGDLRFVSQFARF